MQPNELSPDSAPPNALLQQNVVTDKLPALQPLAVDIAQAAKLIGVSDDTIRREIDRGRLKGVKIGRVWRVRVSELEAYLRRCEVRP